MKADVYECKVMHRRLRPDSRPFFYHIFMMSFDLDDIPRSWVLRHNRFGLLSIHDRDHIDLGEPGGIKANLLAWLAEKKIEVPADVRIQLVTLPRVLGYGFNPVSFFFLEDGQGRPLLAVAEVTNTYREMKLFQVDEQQPSGAWHKRIAKDFYVSPFSDPGDAFDFTLRISNGKLSVNINNLTDGKPTLISSVRGIRQKATSSRLLWYFFKYPLLSLKIILMIHWQAAKLWFRKVPFFRKADRPESQNEVLRPHSSLKKKP